MRTHGLPFALFCSSLGAGCFSPSEDHPLVDDTATSDPASDDDDGMTDDDAGSTSVTSAGEDQGGDQGDDPSDDQGDDPSADATDADDSTSDDPDATDSDPSDDSSSDDAAMPCDGTCVAAAPEGWNGPVTLASAADQPASCADAEYGQEVAAGYAGVVASDATCDCDCDVGEPAVCDDAVLLAAHSDSDCGDIPFGIPVELGCTDIANENGPYYSWEAGAVGGECEALPAVMVPQLGYTGHLAACGTEASAAGACEDDGECVPTPADDAALCWWSDGDVACPASLTGVREVMYSAAPTDTRGCETCTCGAPETSCDAPGVFLVGANNSCILSATSPPYVFLDAGECEAYNSNVQSVFWSTPGTAYTVCDSPSDPDPTGDVVPQGPITVCCAG
jgi:hypothetical protein